ncbi:MAG: DUF3108 domain-containing protein [Proteobacteria bacterium]|nr:DUF3108 domain-containing protein [Pseudomonadota bacterium]
MNTDRTRSTIPRRARAALLAAVLALASGPLLAIEPFNASYGASFMGLQADGRMTLSADGQDRWKYSLDISGAGARLTQSTVFEAKDGQWRPLSSVDTQRGESGLGRVLVKNRTINAAYDWNSAQARWTGDIRPDRSGPVALQAGDLDGMLMNLALVRDVAAGKPLNYRLVEDGKVRRGAFRRAGTEQVTVDGRQYTATKVTWAEDRRSITAWIVDGLPVPARLLQQRDGRDHVDLRLRSLR